MLQEKFTCVLRHIKDSPKIRIPKNVRDWTEIARGGYSIVHSYQDKVNNLMVAIKEVKSSNTKIKDIQEEIKAHRVLNHENVIFYLGCFSIGNKVFLLLEFMDKGSLEDMLEEANAAKKVGKPLLKTHTILEYTRQILEGLKYLHSQPIVHRDLRSPNILLDSANNVKIADFGLSKNLPEGVKKFSTVANYLWHAPEMFNSTQRYLPVDIWSLGIVILEMVFYRPEYFGKYYNHENVSVGKDSYHSLHKERRFEKDILNPMLKQIRSSVTRSLIQNCLIESSAERPTSEELLTDVNRYFYLRTSKLEE